MITADFARSKGVDRVKVDRMCSIAETKILDASMSGLSTVLVEFHVGLYSRSEYNNFIGVLRSKGFSYIENIGGDIYNGYYSVRIRW